MQIPGLDAYKEKWGIGSRSVIEPGLERMERVLAELGNPEQHDKIVHVAGTNGKGSTIAFMKAICESHGVTYGAFQSPAILDVHDQITINGQNATEVQLDSAMRRIAETKDADSLTDFELLTICAFLIFNESNVEIWLIETGMGGRYDSTNVIPQSIAIITSLAIEHTNFLGESLEEIGEHKAGILKQDSDVFLPEDIYLPPFEREADMKNARLFRMRPLTEDIELSLLGEHQRMNATLASTALSQYLQLDDTLLRSGLKKAFIPFRMEKITENIYLDGAHNPAAAKALVETIQAQFSNEKIHFVMGILKDKDFEEVLRTYETVANKFTFVDFSYERALKSNRLVELCRIQNVSCKHISEIDINLLNNDNYRSFITGSLYFLSEWKLKNRI
ncbi:bifunctional folylpolyglutamate synthase/dihydrofolate synthase [Chryseomicrobium palamuruense]|uniref:tetrahydrofolate synthase n=1 Tax=Chryseomicrobium palamuruense TaxID=682973 RepID=A0ABV8UZM8_9BACL